MNGAWHYQEAERLLGESLRVKLGDAAHLGLVADAQAHATLALAAASALPVVLRMMGDDQEITEWGKAIGWSSSVKQNGAAS